jgi:hypothetical protein
LDLELNDHQQLRHDFPGSDPGSLLLDHSRLRLDSDRPSDSPSYLRNPGELPYGAPPLQGCLVRDFLPHNLGEAHPRQVHGNPQPHVSCAQDTLTLSGKSVCGDLLTCIPLFIESVFEVPLKK